MVNTLLGHVLLTFFLSQSSLSYSTSLTPVCLHSPRARVNIAQSAASDIVMNLLKVRNCEGVGRKEGREEGRKGDEKLKTQSSIERDARLLVLVLVDGSTFPSLAFTLSHLLPSLLFSCLMPSPFTSSPLLFPQTGGPSKEAAVRWLVTSLLLNVEAEKDRPSQLLSSSSGFTENLSAGEYERCLCLCHAAQCNIVSQLVRLREGHCLLTYHSLCQPASQQQSFSSNLPVADLDLWARCTEYNVYHIHHVCLPSPCMTPPHTPSHITANNLSPSTSDAEHLPARNERPQQTEENRVAIPHRYKSTQLLLPLSPRGRHRHFP